MKNSAMDFFRFGALTRLRRADAGRNLADPRSDLQKQLRCKSLIRKQLDFCFLEAPTPRLGALMQEETLLGLRRARYNGLVSASYNRLYQWCFRARLGAWFQGFRLIH